jgi:hypothetical protein
MFIELRFGQNRFLWVKFKGKDEKWWMIVKVWGLGEVMDDVEEEVVRRTPLERIRLRIRIGMRLSN